MKGQRLKFLLLLAVLGLFVVAAACKTSGQPGGRAQREGNLGVAGGGAGGGRTFGAQDAVDVSILDFEFVPGTEGGGARVLKGGTVTWTNNGAVDHHPVEDSGYFDLGVIAPGGSVSFTFPDIGAFDYHCALHPEMKGTITSAAPSR